MKHSSYQIAWRLAYDFNFVPLDETMFEVWPIDAETDVYRIANAKTPSRIHILFDEDEYDWYLLSHGLDE